MIRKTLVLLPTLALAGLTFAQAQTIPQSGGGQMAYPTPTPGSGVSIPASRAPDTGSAGYPASPGGVTTAAPRGRDTGSAQTQSGGASLASEPETSPTPFPKRKPRAPRPPHRSFFHRAPATSSTPAASSSATPAK